MALFVSLGMWNHWINSVNEFLPGPKVLELDHVTGHWRIKFANTQVQKCCKI